MALEDLEVFSGTIERVDLFYDKIKYPCALLRTIKHFVGAMENFRFDPTKLQLEMQNRPFKYLIYFDIFIHCLNYCRIWQLNMCQTYILRTTIDWKENQWLPVFSSLLTTTLLQMLENLTKHSTKIPKDKARLSASPSASQATWLIMLPCLSH